MSMPLADKVMGLLTEGLGAWKTFVATRQEAYNRKQDKKKVMAIEAAEKYILVNTKSGEFNDITDDRKKKLLGHYSKRFFHYN